MAGDTLAVAPAGTDYPCHVTFYDGETPRFRRYIASGICRSIALDGAGGACLALETELMFLRGAEESARIPLPGVLAVYAAGGGFCARTAEALHFYSRTGAEWGVYDGPFTLVQVFDGLLCARVRRASPPSTAAAEPSMNMPWRRPRPWPSAPGTSRQCCWGDCPGAGQAPGGTDQD
jgi:hypothetical protein